MDLLARSSGALFDPIRTRAYLTITETGVPIVAANVKRWQLKAFGADPDVPLLEIYDLPATDVILPSLAQWEYGSAGFNFSHTIRWGQDGFEPAGGETVTMEYILVIDAGGGLEDPYTVKHVRQLDPQLSRDPA